MNTQFIDVVWINSFGLGSKNALEYFYTSPFYSTDSNNQIIRTQNISIENLKTEIGLEYALDENLSKESKQLFVIKKQYRNSPTRVELWEIYYILNGVIFCCPDLLDLLRSRISKAAYNISQSFSEIMAYQSHLNQQLSLDLQNQQVASCNNIDNQHVDGSILSKRKFDLHNEKIQKTHLNDLPPITSLLDDIKFSSSS
eukprot:gene8091-10960_t